MMTFLAVIGLIAAVIIFLNLLQAKDAVERIGKDEAPRIDLDSADAAEVQRNLKNRARMRRICPVCRTGLSQDEYLICALEERSDRQPGKKRQVQIYGCVHCFATDGVNMKRYEKIKDIDV